MPADPFRIPDNPDFIFDWKQGGGGGRWQPAGGGTPGGGLGGAGGGGGGGYFRLNQYSGGGFDPWGEQRKRLGMAFGGVGQQGIDPGVLAKLLQMLGGMK